jgi:carbohydrate-selective porin OprB
MTELVRYMSEQKNGPKALANFLTKTAAYTVHADSVRGSTAARGHPVTGIGESPRGSFGCWVQDRRRMRSGKTDPGRTSGLRALR